MILAGLATLAALWAGGAGAFATPKTTTKTTG